MDASFLRFPLQMFALSNGLLSTAPVAQSQNVFGYVVDHLTADKG
jgi:hypothetical protein